MKKPSLHRVFNDKKLRLTVVTGHSFTDKGTKRDAVFNIKRLRKQGYIARLVHSETFGYLIYSNKPWHKIPW